MIVRIPVIIRFPFFSMPVYLSHPCPVACTLCAVFVARKRAGGGRRGPGAGGADDDADMMSAFRADPNADLMDSQGLNSFLLLD